MAENEQESCGVRVWCEACQREDYTNIGDKYKCVSCGKLLTGHEVHHEIFPHVSGDKDHLS